MRKAFSATAALLFGALIWAQDIPGTGLPTDRGLPMTCPVDDHKFNQPQPTPGSVQQSVDSDFCPYRDNGDGLLLNIVVCPRCNYAARQEYFTRMLTDKQKQAALKATAGSKYRGVVDPMSQIPPWERAELALQCAKALEEPEAAQITLLHMASWMARVKAVRPAARAYRIGNPRDIFQGIAFLKRRIERETKPEEKTRLTMHLAMLCERAGESAERDRLLDELEKNAGDDEMLRARIGEFRELTAIEARYQRRALDMIDKQLADPDLQQAAKPQMLYMKGDTLRRLGHKEDAVEAYRAARRLMPEPTESRKMTDYLLTYLAPGEPLPEPEKAVEIPVTKVESQGVNETD